MPSTVTSSISRLRKLATKPSSRGIASSPTSSDTTRKMPSLPSVAATAPALTLPVSAMPESSAMMAMASTSSTMSTPKITCEKRSFLSPSSSSALTMMVVEEMASMAPRNSESISPQPKPRPIS